MTTYHPRPVIVVTGANSGVGFGICHRLLTQLARKEVPESLPQASLSERFQHSTVPKAEGSKAYDGLTLVMACRHRDLAEKARTKLLKILDKEVERLRLVKNYDGHADVFKRNVKVDIRIFDLTHTKSIFALGEEIGANYPYVSHLILNAGMVSFVALDWGTMVKQVMRGPVSALTVPLFKIQRKGDRTNDGLGLVFQSNLFGHYVLYRTLQPMLMTYFAKFKEPSRVIWQSSVEALAYCYNPDDWQHLDNDRLYEASKYSIDMLVGYFEQKQIEEALKTGAKLAIASGQANGEANGHASSSANGHANGSSDLYVHAHQARLRMPMRHFLVHPGVVTTNIANGALNAFLRILMHLSFYFARFLGSPNHPITVFRSAISAVHLALVSLPLVTLAVTDDTVKNATPTKFAAQTTRWGGNYVGAVDVQEWEKNREESARLAEKCENLYQEFLRAEGPDAESKEKSSS